MSVNTKKPNSSSTSNGGLNSRVRNSCYQKNSNYGGGRKSIKCTTLAKALSEQGAQRQRPGSSSPIRTRSSIGGAEHAQENAGGTGSVRDEVAGQGSSPRGVQPDTKATRLSWVDSRDEQPPEQPQQSPRQQLSQQQQPQQQQQNKQLFRKWTKGAVRASTASMKSLHSQPDDEGFGLQAGAASPRWGGHASPRDVEHPDAAGQRTAAALRGVGFRDAGMGQQPHLKQGAGAVSPRSPWAAQGHHMQKTWSTGTLSTAPSPNLPGYRDRLRTAASTASLTSPRTNSPMATPRPRPGDSSALPSEAGGGSSFDSVHADDGGDLHNANIFDTERVQRNRRVLSKQQSQLADTPSGKWQQALNRTMRTMNPTPGQKMMRRASSMRAAGEVAQPKMAAVVLEKINRYSVHAQRDTICNFDDLYGPGPDLARCLGHESEPKKFWKNTVRFLPDLIDDPDKECFDDQVAHAMFGCSVLPRVAEHLTEGNLQRLKPAAFTDRSIRRREGGGCDAVFKGAANYSDRDSDCTRCPASATFPAGLVTSRLPINVPHTVHAGTEASIQPQSPSMRFRCRSGSPNFDSNGIKTTATFAAHKAEKQQQLQQQCQQEEDSFKRRIGRKARSTAQEAGPCSPRFVRPGLDLEASSDQYVRMGSPSVLPSDQLQRTQQGWAGRNRMDTPRRGHVAMTMSPRGDDPPLANSTITGCKKGNGDNKFLVSKDAERLFLRANPTMFRYEAGTHSRDFLRRSCSLPPEYESRVRGDGQTFLTHQEDSGFTKPNKAREQKALVSHNVQDAIQQSRVAESDAQSRAQRLVEDKRFLDLCHITDTTRMQMMADTNSIANKLTVSAGVADSLTRSE
mmetsp:Transcript_59235/g.117372  ORF Transcript_59235/g.117372 Transcript_59235/m.117372 type:complete len:851 (+) Transcript_59235:63-2615(+)